MTIREKLKAAEDRVETLEVAVTKLGVAMTKVVAAINEQGRPKAAHEPQKPKAPLVITPAQFRAGKRMGGG